MHGSTQAFCQTGKADRWLIPSAVAYAGEIIATLQDAVDFDMATEEEKLSLTHWKKYRVLLNRVQPEDAPDIEWPEMPQ